MKNIHFDFVVEGLSDEAANKILDVIIRLVELLGLRMAGGFYEQEDDEG